MRHRLVLILAALLVAAVTVPAAEAQLQREADEAKVELNEASRVLEEASDQRHAVLGDLTAAVGRWHQLNLELEALAFEVGGLRLEVEQQEGRVRSLRRLAEERAVEAYMNGGTPPLLDAALAADSIHQVATAQLLLREVDAREALQLAALDERLSELSQLRRQHRERESALLGLRQQQDQVVDQLDLLFSKADEAVIASHQRLLLADTAYRDAFDLLQELIRLRRETGGGAERWRRIVEHYFPPERVEQALEVMYCESRGNPRATHPLSDAAGLFQFMEQTWGFVSPRAGFGGASRYDAEANIASAAWLLDHSIRNNHRLGDWGRWSCQPTSPTG